MTEANLIQSSHFLEASDPNPNSAPLPAFGTAVFSFSNSQGNSRINAHVSVLFLEEPKEEGEEQPSSKPHQAGSSGVAEGLPEDRPEHADIPPPTQAAPPPSTQTAPLPEKDKAAWDPLPEGMCWIIEEEPDE